MFHKYLKSLILIAPLFITSSLFAFNLVGLGITNIVGPGSNLSSDWCISKTIEASSINCAFLSNDGIFNNTHKVVCTLNVAVAPVFKSDYDEYARGRDEFTDSDGNLYQIWAYHTELPGGNILGTMTNIPLYLLTSQVDGAVNIITDNTLNDLKSKFNQIKHGPEMANAILSVLKQRSCSNISFSSQFTGKNYQPTKLVKVSECIPGPARGNNGRWYNYSACSNIKYRKSYQEVLYSVDTTSGQLYDGKVSADLKASDEFEEVCGFSNNESQALEFCNQKYRENKFKLDSENP